MNTSRFGNISIFVYLSTHIGTRCVASINIFVWLNLFLEMTRAALAMNARIAEISGDHLIKLYDQRMVKAKTQ